MRRRPSGALTRLHRSGAPVALFTFFCFALTFSPARIARAAPSAPEDPHALEASGSAVADAPIAATPPPAQTAAPDPKSQAASVEPAVPDTVTPPDQSSADPGDAPKQKIDPKQATAGAKVTPTASSATAVDPATSEPLSLPTGADKSGVTSKTISVPKGAGTIKGMGESFSAQLSTGIATFSVPLRCPRRAAARSRRWGSRTARAVARGWRAWAGESACRSSRGRRTAACRSYDDQRRLAPASRTASCSTAGRSWCPSAWWLTGGACDGR